MDTRSVVAVQKFISGYNCAQAVLYPFCDDLSLEKDAALRLTTGFGAGMARKQEVCGAVSGGILALGIKHGRGEHQDKPQTEKTYRKVLEFTARFEAVHGTCICRTLLNGCDLDTAEGQKHFKENDLLHKTCVNCVRTAVQAVEKIL